MIEAGVIASYVIAWVARQAGRVVQTGTDTAVDSGLGKLAEVVATKLSGHPVLDDVRDEAGSTSDASGASEVSGDSGDAESPGTVSELTRQQLELALLAAARKDETFAQAVTSLLAEVRAAEHAGGQTVLGLTGTAIAGNVDIRADHGSAAAWNIGTVNLGRPSNAGLPSGLARPTNPDRPEYPDTPVNSDRPTDPSRSTSGAEDPSSPGRSRD